MKRIKTFKTSFIASIIVILIPLFAGLCLWDRLPDRMAMHFNASGSPDAYYSKAFSVFGMTGLMLAIHLICVLTTSSESIKKNAEVPDKVFAVLMWIIPVLSVCLHTLTYAFNLGIKVNIGFWVMLVLGFMFILLGNYIPKVRTNRYVGTRVKWTYESKKNWECTNRFSGRMLFLLGIIFIITAMLSIFTAVPGKVLAAIVIISAFIMPLSMILYSYIFYRKHNMDADYYS